MLAKQRLAKVFFLSTLSVLLLLFAVLYWYSVPLIKKEIYQVELNASRLVLNNVFELANKMYSSLEAYEQEATDGHKQSLKALIHLTENHIHQALKQAQRQGIGKDQALYQFYQDLRHYKYGREDYIWIANRDYHLLSHPDDRFHQTSASNLKSIKGELIIPNIIDDVVNKGEGFYRYNWHRLGEVEAVEKISYVRYFPEWDIFIGTGVYLDDIQAEVKQRQQAAIEELRQALSNIEIAKTGYLFVFDEQGNMLAHPNPNIDQTNALSLQNPLSGQPILQELKDLADTGQELAYKWDRPTDQNNYIYDKLSLVRHIEGFDWYICSSVYVDELQASSQLLSQRILWIGLLALCFTIFLAFWFSKWITRPISRLANVAKAIRHGDLSVRADMQRKDELGLLATTFDDMVGQLQENIAELDQTVAKRTYDLQQAVIEKQQAQLQLAEAHRMNSVGQLAGGLAHDFNNILTVILGNLLILKSDHEAQPGIVSHVDPAVRAAKRGSDITSRLLAFSRRQALSPKPIAMVSAIEETLKLMRGSVSNTIELNFDHAALGDDLAYLDEALFDNCLINLILNARDAIVSANTKAGQIKLVLSELNIDASNQDERLQFDDQVHAGDYLRLEVQDNGSGFSEEALQHACDPFYTSKTDGQGSGLGLSMVYGFIKQSKGYIAIANHLDENRQVQGAKIVILLPKCADSQQGQQANETLPALAHHKRLKNKLVLLVEDNADVRDIIRQHLLQYGLTVIEAGDADEASKLIHCLPDLFALVSDVSMPGELDGFGLADQFKQVHPDSPIVLMSAYADKGKAQRYEVLQKPFAIEALIQRLTASEKQQ